VGIDHFALPSSYLYQAKITHNLHRNFMGYVDKKSPILIGLGPTSISDSSLSFIQNMKEMKDYKEKILQNCLPIEKGHTHSRNDLVIQDIILDLMCKGEVSLTNPKDIPYWNEIQAELDSFAKDGVIERSNDQLSISELGIGFVRNVAMCFDFHLREQTNSTKFSQTI
jgi:oxygen-independent coproporphyrinogen-3 oxidase